MNMRKQNDGTTTVPELAILAGSCGLVGNTDEGRQAFTAWWANDPKAARAALFTRVAARRVAASAAKAQTPAAPPQEYPAGWLRAAGLSAPKAAGQAAPAALAQEYPRGWLRAAGIGGRRDQGTRITQAGD